MGWTGCAEWTSKAAIIAAIKRDELGPAWKILASTTRGSTLWLVAERFPTHGSETVAGPPARHILCFLLEGDRKGGWVYKDLDETMGPCDISCPLSFLEMVPDPGGYATEWRARVRGEAARRADLKANLKVGATLVLRSGCKPASLTCTSVTPLRGEGPYGVIYRIPARHIDHVEAAHA